MSNVHIHNEVTILFSKLPSGNGYHHPPVQLCLSPYCSPVQQWLLPISICQTPLQQWFSPTSRPTMIITVFSPVHQGCLPISIRQTPFQQWLSPTSRPTMIITVFKSSPTMLIAISNASIDDIRHQINCLFTHQFICPIPPFYYIYNRLFSGDVCLTTACTGTNLCSSFVTSISWHITICSDQPWVPIKASLSKN